VRKRLEETAKAKKAKKGFMTPERKKKLRVSGGHVSRDCNFFRYIQFVIQVRMSECAMCVLRK
jgi:hypothetical protein